MPHCIARLCRLLAYAVVSAMLPCAAVAADAPARVQFNRQIRPILSDNCFACHGPDANHREAELRIDTAEGATADLGGRHAIVPGKPDESELLQRIAATDADERMPPADSGKQLTDEQIELIRRWIAEGAEYQPHWAYLPPRRVEAPEVNQRDWPAGPIDRFLLHRLEQEGLSPSPAADPITLCRRLYFDLTGLPPSADEAAEFASDPSDEAYAQLVERLLASPHYGERMAIYWLDLVRYADTVGYHGDQEHAISPYRDYVIAAFNDNLPFDRFTAEQLAGDLLASGQPPEAAMQQRIASRLQPLAANLARRRRAGAGIPAQVRRRPRAELFGRLARRHDGLRRVPRPQVRPVHATRLLQPGLVLRRRRRQPHLQRGRHDAHQARAGDHGAVAARSNGAAAQNDGHGIRRAARHHPRPAPRRLDGRHGRDRRAGRARLSAAGGNRRAPRHAARPGPAG